MLTQTGELFGTARLNNTDSSTRENYTQTSAGV